MMALVLGGGGARGAYQVGVLRRVAELRPDLPFPILVGSSVGAVSVAYIATRADEFGKGIGALSQLWAGLTVDRVFRTDVISLSSNGLRWMRDLTAGGMASNKRARSLLDTSPLEQLISERVAFDNIQPCIDRGLLHAVSVMATSYTTGQSVSFVQGQPGIHPWARAHRTAVFDRLGPKHVLASCAIPFLFPAVPVGDAYYGDGNVRLSYPFSPAAKLGATHILAVSLRHPKEAKEATTPVVRGYPPPAQVAGVLLNSVFLDSFDDDAAQLVRVNALLARQEGINAASAEVTSLRPLELLVLAPSRDLGKLATAYRHRFPPFVRWLLSGVGMAETQSPDLVSYLLFDGQYTQSLLELGYEDAKARTSEIECFLSQGPAGYPQGEPRPAHADWREAIP